MPACVRNGGFRVGAIVVAVAITIAGMRCPAEAAGSHMDALDRSGKPAPANLPRFVSRPAFVVMGTCTWLAAGSESPERYAEIWNAFESRRAEILRSSEDQRYYGVSVSIPGGIEYIAGMAVAPDAPVPPGLVRREIPAGDYAVFACDAAAIGWVYVHVIRPWMESAGELVDPARPSFEDYPPADDTGAPVLIHLPLRARNSAR